jgi:hypothetical protein
MDRDATEAELLEIEGLLQDETLKYEDRFYKISSRPIEAASWRVH